jgi:membrane protease YdiL (CAAX protease family)
MNDDFFDPNLTLFMLISFVLPWEGFTSWCVTCTIRRFARDYSKAKRLNRGSFSFFFMDCFTIVSTLLFYFTNPDGFVLNFKPVPFVILLIVGTLLIPIQTSTEEYIFRGYLMQGFGNLVKHKWFLL